MAEPAQMAYPQPDARERLLSAALVLFTQRSYAAASVREICAAAGVTKPVLYYYFKSKEGLYLELMEGANTQFEDTVAQLIAFPGCASDVFHIFRTTPGGSHLQCGKIVLQDVGDSLGFCAGRN